MYKLKEIAMTNNERILDHGLSSFIQKKRSWLKS